MKKQTRSCALLTYHSAYNYGSALQAFAMQQALRGLRTNADIINYRMEEQKYFYGNILHPRYGFRTLINDISLLPIFGQKKKRNAMFEVFFDQYFTLTEECTEPEDVYALWSRYDTIISGSDQIWNKASCELRNNSWKYMDPYLLKGYRGKKISYASSINAMPDEELQCILPELQTFKALSFRESSAAEHMETLLGRPIQTVLDPTFLLTQQQWIDALGLERYKGRQPFILCYSLAGARPILRLTRSMRILAKKTGLKVIMVTPFAFVPSCDKDIEVHLDYGPREFLEALYNAELVITNSYHGTVLSINFGKEFYLLQKDNATDKRKKDILGRLELTDRIICSPDELVQDAWHPIEYKIVYKRLDTLRKESFAYLKNSIDSIYI